MVSTVATPPLGGRSRSPCHGEDLSLSLSNSHSLPSPAAAAGHHPEVLQKEPIHVGNGIAIILSGYFDLWRCNDPFRFSLGFPFRQPVDHFIHVFADRGKVTPRRNISIGNSITVAHSDGSPCRPPHCLQRCKAAARDDERRNAHCFSRCSGPTGRCRASPSARVPDDHGLAAFRLNHFATYSRSSILALFGTTSV